MLQCECLLMVFVVKRSHVEEENENHPIDVLLPDGTPCWWNISKNRNVSLHRWWTPPPFRRVKTTTLIRLDVSFFFSAGFFLIKSTTVSNRNYIIEYRAAASIFYKSFLSFAIIYNLYHYKINYRISEDQKITNNKPNNRHKFLVWNPLLE